MDDDAAGAGVDDDAVPTPLPPPPVAEAEEPEALPPAPTIPAPTIPAPTMPEPTMPAAQAAPPAPSSEAALPPSVPPVELFVGAERPLELPVASASAGGSSSAAAASSSEDDGAATAPIEDIVLRSSRSGTAAEPQRTAGSTSLAATLEIVEHTRTIEDLESLLQQECVRAIAVGIHAEAVSRCVQYVGGLTRPKEVVLCGWPILSINEWGSQQVRTLVLSSHALYRVAFSHQRGAIDHYSRTLLGSIQAIERGRYAFKLLLTEPDGRENPVTYFWSAYVKKNAKDNRYERVYYPIHPEGLPVELAMGLIISSIAVANRLLCDKVGDSYYVTQLVVRDYVPSPNAVDELMDKIGPSLKAVGDKVSDAVRSVFPPQQSAAARGRRR